MSVLPGDPHASTEGSAHGSSGGDVGVIHCSASRKTSSFTAKELSVYVMNAKWEKPTRLYE